VKIDDTKSMGQFSQGKPENKVIAHSNPPETDNVVYWKTNGKKPHQNNAGPHCCIRQ